ncbi:MAG: AAA family ATPase [Candidatus Omnitrophota bacterium]
MKVAFSGKGGVGKTTLASLFIRALAQEAKEVLAVDCDPDSNLAHALGFENFDKIQPIAEMEELIHRRMGVEKGNKSFFQLNPKIDDIPDAFSKQKDNIKLIVMGAVEEGGTGCMCPENTFIKNLLQHLIVKKNEHVVLDMEAGVEHFGRGTAESCNAVLIVVEPSLNSLGTAEKIATFARDIGIKRVYALGNKIRTARDNEFIRKQLGKIQLAAAIDFDQDFLKSDQGATGIKAPLACEKKIAELKRFLEEELNQ